MHKQFFILGYPRSGTTLLRLMLNSHPEMSVPPECGYLQWLTEKNKENKNNLEKQELLEQLLKCRKIENLCLSTKDFHSLPEKTNLGFFFEYVQKKIAQNQNRFFIKWYGDKNNYYIHHIDLIQQQFPQSKRIYMIRDIRDILASYSKMRAEKITSNYAPNLEIDSLTIIEEWCDFVDAAFADDQNIMIKYEDLLTSPIASLTEICDALSLKYSSNMLKFYQNNDEPSDFLQWKQKTIGPLDGNNIGSYRENVSKEDIELATAKASQQMKKFSYL